MTTFTIDTDVKSTRPKILVHGIEALVDTGAQIPVCMFSETVIKTVFNARQVWTGSISGIGGECPGKVFIFDKITVGQLVFPDIPFFVPDDPVPEIRILLSASMFYGLDYEFKTKDHLLKITVPDDEPFERRLTVSDSNGRLHVLCNGISLD